MFYGKKKKRILLISFTKNVRELSWMSHGIMRFWFLLNFLFISAFFDILALLSISRDFSSGIPGDEHPPAQIFLEQLSNFIIYLKFNVWGTFLSHYKYFSCQSRWLLSLLQVCKSLKQRKISVGGSEQRRDALFWIHLRETWLELFKLL